MKFRSPFVFGNAEPEQRAAMPGVNVVHASGDGWLNQLVGVGSMSSTGERVTIDAALGVPAVFASVNFLSGTIAGLPLHVYRKKDGGAEKVGGTLSDILAHAANDEQSAFDFRHGLMQSVFTNGRGLAYIDRNAAGNPINLDLLDPNDVTVKMGPDLRKRYQYREGRRTKYYEAADIIDIPFMVKPDRVSHISPILKNAEAIGLSLAAMKYGAKVFQNGGLPPLVLEGQFASAESAARAVEDLTRSIAKKWQNGDPAVALPNGYSVKALGFKPDEMQLVDLQRWCVEQIARIYSLPPTFLQDLTNGTHSNTEQQDLHFVKHTLRRWLQQVEQEMNLKLIGRGRRSTYVKFNVDGLLRGDYMARMTGNAKAITTGQLTPNEARALEDRPSLTGGDELFIQGANVPVKAQAKAKPGGMSAKVDKGDGGNPDDD